MPLALRAAFAQTSRTTRIVILTVILLVIVIPITVHFVHRHTEAALHKDTIKLKEENRQITDEYWEAVGERNALRVQAQQLKLEADAYREQGAQRGANVAALDKKIETVRGQYEEIQTSVGDCSSVAECRKQLCDKYKAAGIRLKNCAD